MVDFDSDIIDRLRRMKDTHATASEMLAELVAELRQLESNYEPLNFICIIAFRRAFGLSIKEAMPIGGWEGFGGPISSTSLDREMDSWIYGRTVN